MVQDWHLLDAVGQGEAVRKAEVTPAELVEHYLARIERFDPQLHAFVTVTADAAREAAARWVPGNGPLDGVPTAIKDLTAVKGVRLTFGSKAYAEYVAGADAHSVTLLRKAGMISLGKTNTPEFGAAAYSDNDVTGSTRTPWRTTLTAGGSSGGAAAAVAAGLVAVAQGSDGGGSLRIPASACGVFGFKPSRGRVSNGPIGVDVTGLSIQGPIARSVRDAAAMLDAIAVPMPGDPFWAPPLPDGETFFAATQRDPGKLRIARYADSPDAQIDAQCLAAYEETTNLLVSLGHEVEEIANPFPAIMKDHFLTAWAVQQLAFPVPETSLRPMTRWWRQRGRATSAEDFLAALAGMQLAARRVLEKLTGFDAILNPTLGMPPQEPSWFAGPQDRAVEMERQTAFTPFAAAYNITGQPSASLPLHWTSDGLPIGSMVTGRPAGDAALFSLCAQIEAASPWSHRWPGLDQNPEQLGPS